MGCPRHSGQLRRRQRFCLPSNWRARACRMLWRKASNLPQSAKGRSSPCGARMTSSPSLFGSCEAISRLGHSAQNRRRRERRWDCYGSSAAGRNSSRPLQRLGRKLRQFATIGHQRVGGQDCRPARIGQDGKPRTLGARLSAEHFRHIEKIGDIVDAQNSASGGRPRPELRRCP